jgi:hypothetical protein
LFAAAFYGITESGFRLLNPMWIFLLLAIVASSGIASGVFGGATKTLAEPGSLRNIQAGQKQRLEVMAPVRRTT